MHISRGMFLSAVLSASLALSAISAGGQDHSWGARAYRSAVAHFFDLPEAEITILGHWDLPPDEVPVVLFMARRAGVSPEALVALKESGWTWTELAQRYRIGAPALYVPLRDAASAGALAPVYEQFRSRPAVDWADIRLSESDIVTLVNVRVLSQSLGVSPDEIMRRTGGAGTFVDLYVQLIC